MLIAGLAIEMLVAPLAGFLTGHWADDHFDTAPFLLLAGLALGVFVAIRVGMRLVYVANRYEEQDNTAEAREKKLKEERFASFVEKRPELKELLDDSAGE